MTKLLTPTLYDFVITNRTANWSSFSLIHSLAKPILVFYLIILDYSWWWGKSSYRRDTRMKAMLVAWFCNDNLRLPGSSLTWWRDSSAAPCEASPSSCRRRSARGGTTTSPTCPSWRRSVGRSSTSISIHNQEFSSQLGFSFCKFARQYSPAGPAHFYPFMVEMFRGLLTPEIWSDFKFSILFSCRTSSRLTPRPRRCWRWWTSRAFLDSRWPPTTGPDITETKPCIVPD